MRKHFQKLKAICILGILLVGGGNFMFGQTDVPHNPFVYMRDNMFYYQGEIYNMMSCNYLLSWYFNDEGDFIVAPHGNYSWNSYDTQADASKYLHAHFKLIKEMGFNSIRIMNASMKPRHDSDELAMVLSCRGCDLESNPDPVPKYYEAGFREFDTYLNMNNGGLNYFKQGISIILDIAAVYDLKVIWVTGCEARYFDNGQKYRSLLQHYGHPINVQYKNAMADIANEFENNTALIGYDLFHELESFANSTENINQLSVANSVDEIVAQVKENDCNHITTAGLFNISSFFKIGVKPFQYVDFYNFHVYETVDLNTLSILPEEGMSINRYIKYFNETIDKPWMIGENGMETTPEYEHEKVEGDYSVSENMQRISAEKILKFTTACGSLGFTYWEFANELMWQNVGLLKYNDEGNIPVEINTTPAQTVYCNFNYKEIVNGDQNIFKTFNVNTVGQCDFNEARYYDLLLTEPTNNNQTWEGRVVDQDSHAIENAVVKIRVDGKDFYTFTDEEGYYSLTTPTNRWDGMWPNPNLAHSITASKYNYSTVSHYNCAMLNTQHIQLNYISFPAVQSNYNNILVNSGETKILNQPTMITGHIYVYNGGTLRINSTICFDDNSQLKVYPGGKVILEDGAVLTAKHEHWLGIVMMNFNNLTNIPDSYLSSSGNTIIANAFQGITSHYDNYIYLNGTKFINNYQDVYINNNHAETVVFRNCDFILNEDALEQYSVSNSCDNHVRIYTSDKVTFTNCHFDDQRTYGNPPNKVGIYAYNLEVLQVLPDPLITTRRSSFTNLQYGIYAFSANGDGIVVKNCDFNTVRGIYLYNYAGFFANTITNNNFIIKNYVFPITTDKTGENPGDDEPEDEFYYRSYGIYIDMFADRYQIEGNTFTSETGFATNKYGIVANNNGAFPKRFYRNNFTSLENAVQSINQNRSTNGSSFEGLQVICNNFNSTKTDIYVTSEVNVPNWGIASFQGSPSSPAANLFSTNTPSDCFAFNNELTQITYFVRLNSDPYYNYRELPMSISDNIYMYAKHFGIPNACPNGTNKLPKPVDRELMRAEMATAKSLETAITTMLDDIVDGGNTGLTISSVLHSEDNSAWLTYYQLMNKSPYLSDTVLKEVSKKEQGLTAPMIRDILVANPQGIKNKDLQQMLMDRNNPLPDYMIEQIKTGQGIISAKENLEIQRAEQQQIYEECLITLVDFYMSAVDSLPYAMDSIDYLLREKKEAKYMYILADFYFERSDFATAQTVLDKIVVDCDLTENELGQNRDLYSFYSLYDYLMRYYKNDLSALNETHIAQLKQFELKGGFAGTKARALLMLNNATDYREAVYTPVAPIGNRSFKTGSVNNSNPYFSVYPNPAKEYFYFEYSVPEAIGTMQVVVSDISGKILLQKQISELRDIVIIKTVELPSGTYNCTFYNGNKSVYNGKIIVE